MNIRKDEHKPPCLQSIQPLPGLIPQEIEARALSGVGWEQTHPCRVEAMCLGIRALNILWTTRMCIHGILVILSTLCLHGVLRLTLRRTFFLGRSSSGFHTSHWTSWGSLGFSSVWSLCQQPTIFFSLIYFLILTKIWPAPHSKK